MTAVARTLISRSPWREPATQIRQAPGQYVRGRWQPGEETATAINVVSAPPSAATRREILPEGARLRDWRTFWFDAPAAPLRVGEGQTDGDVILYKGVRYRLRQVADWGQFVEALGIREERQE